MSTPNGIRCSGWWQQPGLGRQAMHELRLSFDGGELRGSGHDVVGLFTLTGTLNERGAVALVKQYLGQHAVDYLGTYDGEGLLYGEWRIGHWHDKWLIRIQGSPASGGQGATEIDIKEIA
jgi:hypothetical protein